MPPQKSEFDKQMQHLDAEIRRLEAEYNMFFSGRLPRPPFETKNRVHALVKKHDNSFIRNTADRFRFEMLQSRFQTMVDVWDRGQRAREEGRPGPFAAPPPTPAQPDARRGLVHLTAFTDPMREMDKVHALYDSLMEARRRAGEQPVPFHRFAALVKDQVTKLKQGGTEEVGFRVAVQDGKVSFTVRALKSGGR